MNTIIKDSKMKVLKSELNSLEYVKQLEGLEVLINDRMYKPSKFKFFLGGDEMPDQLPGKEVHLIEFLMPNYAYKTLIECSIDKVEEATNRMLDIYNKHMRNLKLVQ